MNNVQILYSELSKLQTDSARLSDVIALLNLKFPDDTCQLLAIKGMLGIETVNDDAIPTDPADPSGDPTP